MFTSLCQAFKHMEGKHTEDPKCQFDCIAIGALAYQDYTVRGGIELPTAIEAHKAGASSAPTYELGKWFQDRRGRRG